MTQNSMYTNTLRDPVYIRDHFKGSFKGNPEDPKDPRIQGFYKGPMIGIRCRIFGHLDSQGKACRDI